MKAFFVGSLVLMLAACGSEEDDCCKICDQGQACGDTCISRSYTCSEPPGCACNAN